MGKAVRAIIRDGNKLLVMHRDKHGSQYYTLVGGRVSEGESLEQALVREVKEETGLDVTAARLVFTEDYEEPYNSQYIFLCEVALHDSVGIAETSEEGFMNKIGMNIHTPRWVESNTLAKLQFRTPVLHKALIDALKNGFPSQPVKL
jgi:ADP-ribose pyrophosphatase YjhB (NUDIX family)